MKKNLAILAGTALAVSALVATHAPADAAGTKHTLTGLSVSMSGKGAGKNAFIGTDKFVVNGKTVGFDTVAGHVSASGATHIDGAIALAGGILYYTGTLPDGVHETGHVTGGTGRYRGAQGTMTATVLDNGNGGVQASITWWK